MRGSNFYVKKTAHGDIRRHFPEGEDDIEG